MNEHHEALKNAAAALEEIAEIARAATAAAKEAAELEARRQQLTLGE